MITSLLNKPGKIYFRFSNLLGMSEKQRALVRSFFRLVKKLLCTYKQLTKVMAVACKYYVPFGRRHD